MAAVDITNLFYFSRLDPGQSSHWWVGPWDAWKNATITCTAHAFEGIGPTETLTMSTRVLRVENRPPFAERIVWIEVTNLSRIPVRSFHVYISAVR